MPIETYEEFKNWLYEQPRETCVLIAMRAALRVFPLVARGETSAPEKQKLALLAARATLTSGVAAKMPTPEVKAAAARAARAASATFAANAAAFAADAAVSAASATSFAISAFATDAAFAAYSAHAAARAATNADADIPVADLFDKPLWREPDGLMKILADKKNILDTGPEWAFWRDWYQGFLDGKPLDWDLQRLVAIEIGDDIWKAGPGAVAEKIEQIRARYVLEQEITNLKEQLNATAAVAEPHHRLHNHPPEAVDDEVKAIRTEISSIWDQIENLETEIAKPEPSRSNLSRIAQALQDISVRIAKYCGSVADVVVKEAAKTGTRYTLRTLVAITAAQNESIRSVATAIWEFVKTLPPG